MELFRQTNIDFVGKMKLAMALSLALMVASVASLVVKGGPKWGIDFRGGTVVTVKFLHTPPIERIRSAIQQAIKGEITVQEITTAGSNEVVIGTEMKNERALDEARRTIIGLLAERFGNTGDKLDLNNASTQQIVDRLRDPLQRAGVPMSEQDLQSLASRLVHFRDTERSGVVANLNDFSNVQGVNQQVTSVLKDQAALAPFSIRSVEIVGPKAGSDLQKQALLATLYALGGMLVYIALRFEFVSGVASVIALIHDTVITVGFFSVLNREINLTVIAALLTLIGYSMNDTIVVFDRIRENQKLRFRDAFPVLVNNSINQTLSRTLLTASLTFLTTIALYFLGGAVLNNFALALCFGIVIGTYSSIFVASSILVWWHIRQESRKQLRAATSGSPAVSNAKETTRKVTSRR